MINLTRLLILACLVFTVSSVPINKDADMEKVEKAVKNAVAHELLENEQGVNTEKLIDEEVDVKPTKDEHLVDEMENEHAKLVDEEEKREEGETKDLVDGEDEEKEEEKRSAHEEKDDDDDDDNEEEEEHEPMDDDEDNEEDEESRAEPLIDEESDEEDNEKVNEKAVENEEEIVKDEMKVAKEIVKKAFRAERLIAEKLENSNSPREKKEILDAEKLVAKKAMEAEKVIAEEVMEAEKEIVEKTLKHEKEISGDEEEEKEAKAERFTDMKGRESKRNVEEEEGEETHAEPMIDDEDNEEEHEEHEHEHENEDEDEETHAEPMIDDEDNEEEHEEHEHEHENEDEDEETHAEPLVDDEDKEEEQEHEHEHEHEHENEDEDEDEETHAEPMIDDEDKEEEHEEHEHESKDEERRSVNEEEEEKKEDTETHAEPLVDDEDKEEEHEEHEHEHEDEDEVEETHAEPMVDDEDKEEEHEEHEEHEHEHEDEDEDENEDEETYSEPMVDIEEKEEEEVKKEVKEPVSDRILDDTSALVAEDEVKEEMVKNPCETANFKYYQPDPVDPTKYYQCDPWGTFTHHTCENEMIWDKWTLKCQMKENIRNLTSLIPEPILKMSLFNCTTKEQACQNGGKCIKKDEMFTCKCTGKFTGRVCEIEISDIDMFTNIMKGNATLKDYAAKLVEESADMDITYYKKYEKVLNKKTYEKMMSYLRRYKDGLVRYDILVNSLVEDLLVDVYPDAEFLRSFNVSTKNVLTVVRLIPNLLSYAKYSAERYEEVFVQYQRVLDELFGYLNTTCPNMTHEAFVYAQLTRLFLKDEHTEKMNEAEPTKNEMEAMKMYGRRFFKDELKSEEIVKKTIKSDFDVTLEKTYKLHRLLVTFEKAVAQEYKKNPEFVHQTLIETTLPGVHEVINLFNEIQTTNIQIWESLVSYGFWYVTNLFVAPTPIVDAQINM